MALADDLITVALLASAGFFVALSVGLLLRYRQVSQRISTSTDLGRDLWSALEQRMRKQDERILDVMGRLEVVQSRVMAAAAREPPIAPVFPAVAPPSAALEEEPEVVMERNREVQQPPSQPESQESHSTSGDIRLDETQLSAIKLLGESPKNTRQLTDALRKSREHTARVMKELFEKGLVRRNDSTKPFVYQLTDDGRRYITTSGT